MKKLLLIIALSLLPLTTAYGEDVVEETNRMNREIEASRSKWTQEMEKTQQHNQQHDQQQYNRQLEKRISDLERRLQKK